ncbi:hypothetical protein Hanom_Chr05g00471521 [Helianthus anomalus]
MMDRFLPRHGSIRRATRFYTAVTPARFSCWDNIVSGQRLSARGRAIEHRVREAGLTGDCLRQEPGNLSPVPRNSP